jgi:uncharacterized protein (TIGR03083 family)
VTETQQGTQGPTRAELLDALRSSEAAVVRRLADVPPEALNAGCYENGWNARQVLAHVASIEWTYPRLLDLARSEPQSAADSAARTSSGSGGGIGGYNQRQVERYADASVKELIDLFRKNRAATIAAVEAADDDLFAQPVRSAGGITGTLGHVLNMVAVAHVLGHVNDIVNAAGEAS